jgi:hypothetical protein
VSSVKIPQMSEHHQDHASSGQGDFQLSAKKMGYT